ncbi:MAG: hypothetical protein DRQ55_09235 [Planctomycetota bacterium]|nr:MAG: hypothetical protein DRQ55_09235 [Planctomycetota bacterium]
MTRQTYDHVQRGWLHWLLLLLVIVQITGVVMLWDNPNDGASVTRPMLMAFSGVLIVLSLCFQQLRVRDVGDRLEVRFGPVPLLRRSVRYADITRATPSRSSLLDGWLVHWAPGGGWIWNIWGRDVVELTLTDGRLRVGTNDQDGLLEHLQQRIGSRAAG